jgi:hypothetical protein
MLETKKLFEVHGEVSARQGIPVEGAEVIVWWQQIRDRRELAKARTSQSGAYRISYEIPPKAPERLTIVVEAQSKSLDKLLVSPLTEARQDLQIDLRLEEPDTSEWTMLGQSLQEPLDSLKLSDVVENDVHRDISFLSLESGKDTETLMRSVIAARLEESAGVPAAIFYAFLTQHVPSALPNPLLEATQNFTLIDALVQRIGSLIYGLPADLQQSTLTTAIALNLIGPQYAGQIPQIVTQLQALHTSDLLNQPYLAGKSTLSQLLDVVKLPQPRQQAFAQALATNQLSMRNFWRTLGDGKYGFTAAEASGIERTLSLGAFVKNHLPLVQLLLQGFSSGTYKTLPDLARLSEQDWIALVNQSGPPPSIDAAGTASPAEVFARVVYARVTRAYPTAALSSRIAAGNIIPPPQRAPLAQFFQNNPALELSKHNIPVYLAAQGDKAFAGIAAADQPAVIDNARRFQRVLRVAPSVDAAETLLGLGIHSAVQIATMGDQQFFVKATQAGISKPEANRIYRAGAQRYASTVSLYMKLNRDAVGVWPRAIGNTADLDQPSEAAVARDETLTTLFGSQDYCAVDSCASLLSPAAYLCDLLLWLSNHPQGAQTVLDVFDGRRADVRHLLLNCSNSETPLPYIDLVNELLADAISPPNDPNSTVNPPWKQTSANKTAEELRAAPEYFNAGAYTTLFGASYPHTLPYSAGLDELRTYLQQLNVPLWQVRQALMPLHNPPGAMQAAVAAERLGMTPHEQDLITNIDFVPADSAWNIANATSAVPPVPAFLQAASITYESMLELLQVGWVQGALNISIQGIDDTCNTGVQALAPAPLDAGFLDRAHRFLRLWRRTGYKMWELDLLLNSQTVGKGVLNQDTLIALQSFWQLQAGTGLAVDQQLAFYQDIDTSMHRDPDGTTTTSLYGRVFLNPAVTAVAADPDLVALPTGGVIQNPHLDDHLAAIQAALGVSAADAATLFGLTDNQLTLDNLSLIYRVAALAKAARFDLSDILAVAGLLAPGSADAVTALAPILRSPDTTRDFLAQAKSIQQSGFTIDALTYLLTPPLWTTTTQMTEANIASALGAVRQAILQPTGDDVNGSAIAAVAANAHRPADRPLANDSTALILGQLQLGNPGTTLLALLTDPSLASQTPITVANFQNQFLAIQLFDKVATVARRLRLVSSDLAWLMGNAAVLGGLDFTQLPVESGPPAIALSPLLTTLLLVKLARLFTAAPPQSSVQTLYDVIDGVHSGAFTNEAAVEAALATITGWPLPAIASFVAALGITFPADYSSPAVYDALRNVNAMAATASVSADQLVAWAGIPTTEPEAETLAASALGAIKARHPNNDDWLAFAPTITDPIRERRSAALQAYLIGQRDAAGALIYDDVNGLFDHFLIDVQMSSCQVTTRVVQAYIAVQIFVERCLMNLEAPAVVADLTIDDTWNQWQWMKRYRIWEANREVFLYPENWLIESQRPNRTEIYRKLEQDVRQNASTSDYVETVVLNYVDRLEDIAHLQITGTCQDPVTGAIHVVGRSQADPPFFYFRSLIDGAWTGWTQIPLDIHAYQAVPAMYRGRVCVFWPEVKASNEPHQAVGGSSQPSQEVGKYVSLGVYFSIYRNNDWSPAQTGKSKFFDKPLLSSASLSDSRSLEALYTLKVQTAAPSAGVGTSLNVDVFRFGSYQIVGTGPSSILGLYDDAVHVGRAVFDGRLNEVQQRNLSILIEGTEVGLLEHAQNAYGPDAQLLLPLPDVQAEPSLLSEPNMHPQSGAQVSVRPNPTGSDRQTVPLVFAASAAQGQNAGTLLGQAPMPFRVVGSASDPGFDPSSYFFFQDNRRSFYVEPQKTYQTGSMWSPTYPSNPNSVPFQLLYNFHRFYHPFARLFWHQLSSGGFPLLYDRNLQLNPDQIDASGADAFSFQTGYQPVLSRVNWDRDDLTNQDREYLDFNYNSAFSVYNWELFFHIPLYMAEMLSQNQQFEDALEWFHYIFDPTRPGTDPAPTRFWIPKPLYSLTSAQILAQQIDNLLVAINQGDPNAIHQVEAWQNDPFNPFLLADLRPVAYMKRTVMSYLDNLIAWADNLFASESREALSEATLLYVIASQILGPKPVAVTPPQHADESFDQLEPALRAFADAMVEIENSIGGQGGGTAGNGGIPAAPTFYFKIPPNDTLLSYWTTVEDRLFKLRHCQNIQGQSMQLALFDAPIDPGLLIKAQSAGVDLNSVLADLGVGLPNYRFTFLYTQALDFVNAVRAYGALLLAALEKSDADQLAVLIATNQQQILQQSDQIFAWQVEQAQSAIDALNQSLKLGQDKLAYFTDQSAILSVINTWENMALQLQAFAIGLNLKAAFAKSAKVVQDIMPPTSCGAAGISSPLAYITEDTGKSTGSAAKALTAFAALSEKSGNVLSTMGKFYHQQDDWKEKITETEDDNARIQIQIAGAELGLLVANANQAKNQTQIDQLQNQLDFLTGKFTNQDLYDWMVGQLSDTYFQSFGLAYRMCQQVEQCYRFELGIQNTSFIQFGYWDSLHKGLLAGERLNQDLRAMQSSYLDQNVRRLELSRFISLNSLGALSQLLATGACDFTLPESLFDHDYPGHYNRHLFRVSVTAVYPNPTKFDNIKATLTLMANKVRTSTDLSAGYTETPVGTDPRFIYTYAANSQKIALGNAQDDPGLFLTALNNNLTDTRYLPFENAGAVSSWHLEMQQANNEVVLANVTDIWLHLYYTAQDGGDAFKQAVEADNLANQPTSGFQLVSPQSGSSASPVGGTEGILTFAPSPSQFPGWTLGKSMTVTSLSMMAVSWSPDSFVLEPRGSLPDAPISMTPVPDVSQPNVLAGTLALAPDTTLDTWTFRLRKRDSTGFHPIGTSDIGDVFLLVSYQVS